jgi:hypothetical protein
VLFKDFVLFLADHPAATFGFFAGFFSCMIFMAFMSKFRELVEGGAGARLAMVEEYKRQANLWRDKWTADFEEKEIEQ